jgi:HEAT repeat protein
MTMMSPPPPPPPPPPSAGGSPLVMSAAERERAAAVDRLVALGEGGLAELLGMLSDPSWTVRRSVVAGLAALGDVAVAGLCEVLATQRDNEARLAAAVDALAASMGRPDPHLERLIEHPNPAVVADAVQVLGRRRSAAAVPIIVRVLDHADDNVAVAVVEALGRVGGRAAVDSLIQAVATGNFFRVFPAIDVLGRSGDPRAVEPLAALLGQSTYALEAARALGRTGERAAAGPLVRLLAAQSDAMVRVAALAVCDLLDRARERTGTSVHIEEILRREAPAHAVRQLGRCLALADVSESVAICRVLGLVGGEGAVPILSQRLDAAAPVAEAAADSLHRLGHLSDTEIARALREGDSARRKVLLPTVARSSVMADVARCLEDPDAEVRAQACDTLARLGNVSVVGALFALLEDANMRVVHAAIGAIQALGSAEARALAMQAAVSPSAAVRRSALRILAYFGDAEALDLFLDALRDPDPRVRDVALQGLPYIEDKRALDALFEAARDESARIRGMAMRALGQCAREPRVPAFLLRGLADPDAWVRYYACQSLGKLGYEAAAPRIAELLAEEAGQVRVAAVEALSHLQSDEAHEALRQAAESEDLDVRRAALIGLGVMGRPQDVPLLLSALSAGDSATRLVVLSALAHFSSPAVFHAMARAASDMDEQVSTAAIGFLAARAEQEATDILVQLLASSAARERALAGLLVPSQGRVPGLLGALEVADDELAPVLTSTLAKLQRADATAALLQALWLPNVAARKAAASTLAALGSAEAMAALKRAADTDPDPGVRQICALLLAQ